MSRDVQSRSASELWQSGNVEASSSWRKGSTVHSQARRHFSDSTFGEGYESSQKSLLLSRQTSASALPCASTRQKQKDLSTDLTTRNMSQRSTIEQSEVLSNQHASKGLDRLTITDLLDLFPRPNAPNNPILSPPKRKYSPSAVTDTSEFVSQEEKDVQKRRSSRKALLERHDGTEFPWIECRGLSGAYVAEPDLPVFAQNDVTRPKTVIRYGYHDCDASTCKDPPKEKHPSRVSRASLMPRRGQGWGASGKAVHNQAVQDQAQYSLHQCSIARSMLAGQMLEAPNGTQGIMANDAAVFAAVPSSTEQCASGLGPSQLQSPEVPSRSSPSGDLRTNLSLEQDDFTGSYDSGAKDRIVSIPLPLDVERPSGPTRRIQVKSSFLREDTVVPQTVRQGLLGSTPDFSSPTVARRATPAGYHDPCAAAMGKKKGSLKLASKKSLEHVRSQSFYTRDHGDRTASESASNFPTDASYMVAVTEQEMALLLMMRHKRAAIKRGLSAEGLDLL
ncbi:hypothetical protein LTR91_024734 [Friedmanniomyces endolithicus]|uniref:Uncharacterized protein n=1 Tax=Friedmanniomyces endolithicus TaxID=329885 RepID=A0AAN6H464_9PEZI|nr:hypothetical protein LTS09_017329 [Friedmanniomyces endolithicus]KAK0951875.1 hypothetical protein LTR91_024734 [Friedmanniomyces endolithicus]